MSMRPIGFQPLNSLRFSGLRFSGGFLPDRRLDVNIASALERYNDDPLSDTTIGVVIEAQPILSEPILRGQVETLSPLAKDGSMYSARVRLSRLKGVLKLPGVEYIGSQPRHRIR